MCDEKMWERVLTKSKVKYFKETEGKLVTIFIATDKGSHEYQFHKGTCILSKDCNESFEEMLNLFIWAFNKCPYTKLDIYGGEPVLYR